MSGPEAPIEIGNALPLENIPVGFTVHNVELNLGRGGQMARSAGAGALIVGQGRGLRDPQAALRRASAGVQEVHRHHRIGVGNEEHMNERYRQGRAHTAGWVSARAYAVSP